MPDGRPAHLLRGDPRRRRPRPAYRARPDAYCCRADRQRRKLTSGRYGVQRRTRPGHGGQGRARGAIRRTRAPSVVVERKGARVYRAASSMAEPVPRGRAPPCLQHRTRYPNGVRSCVTCPVCRVRGRGTDVRNSPRGRRGDREREWRCGRWAGGTSSCSASASAACPRCGAATTGCSTGRSPSRSWRRRWRARWARSPASTWSAPRPARRPGWPTRTWPACTTSAPRRRSDRDVPYIVMELVEGQTLSEHMNAGPIDWRIGVRICAEVAAALAAAHAEHVVHRDIKPANIMLTPAGAKVLDFGIAAAVGTPDPDPDGPGDGHAGLRGPGTLRGTAGHPGDRHVRAGHAALPLPVRPAAVARRDQHRARARPALPRPGSAAAHRGPGARGDRPVLPLPAQGTGGTPDRAGRRAAAGRGGGRAGVRTADGSRARPRRAGGLAVGRARRRGADLGGPAGRGPDADRPTGSAATEPDCSASLRGDRLVTGVAR